ncbi:MAG: glycosyltransferase N-terminal domain-containing protein, partial [Pseudomonadota bacterium]|nr:glycosyltransferase N-terminal domain-containing protein [Pseudomonadota bacterium]
MILSLYRAVMNLGRPLASPILRRRVRQGKEDALRLDERRGVAARARPVTPRLIWIHAASVGESVSALPLINHTLDDDPEAHVLLTTGTRTSAALMADRLPARALHQYVPIDRPAWIKRFLAHWRPCVGILIENEIWPNLIFESKAAGLPLVLVNGRLSAHSFKRWRWIPGIARKLFGQFDLI